jgi:hypothetical protein
MSDTWPTIHPATIQYYDRYADLDLSIQVTREQVDEWDYESDAHGYCHNRSCYATLVRAAEWAREHGYTG